jgi:hypothetical protein
MKTTELYRSLRRLDNAPAISETHSVAGGGTLDHNLFTGMWVNTDPQSPGIQKVALAGSREGVRMHVYGAGAEGNVDWGVAEADTVYAANLASQAAMSFTGTYDFGFATAELQGNINLGLLVLASFNTFRAGGKQSNYFGREFFYQADDQVQHLPAVGVRALPRYTRLEELTAETESGSLETSMLTGDWRNTNTKSDGIARVLVREDGSGCTIQCYGAGDRAPYDWGEIPAQVFALEPSSGTAKAFSGLYDHGFMKVRVQANVKQGVLVIAYFTEFRDGSPRSNYFSREFYYR